MDKNKIIILVIVAIFIILTITSYILLISNQKNKDKTLAESSVYSTSTPGIVIIKGDITSTAKIYTYKSGDTEIQVMAVKADNGSIRTALNTCQVCYSSGRGYYVQQGKYMVCQNCGNRFNINDIEKVKGGCNPVPILEKNKTDNVDTITISTDYLNSKVNYFKTSNDE